MLVTIPSYRERVPGALISDSGDSEAEQEDEDGAEQEGKEGMEGKGENKSEEGIGGANEDGADGEPDEENDKMGGAKGNETISGKRLEEHKEGSSVGKAEVSTNLDATSVVNSTIRGGDVNEVSRKRQRLD